MFDEFIFENRNKITNCLLIHPFPILHHFLEKPDRAPSPSPMETLPFTAIKIIQLKKSGAKQGRIEAYKAKHQNTSIKSICCYNNYS